MSDATACSESEYSESTFAEPTLDSEPPIVISRIKRHILLCAGFACLALGGIGIVLPLLPTTPFVLLAAILFGKSSPKFQARLETNRVFGPYIENHRTGAGVPFSTKVGALVFLWTGLAVSAFLARHWWVWVILVIVGIAVTTHLARLKTKVSKQGLGVKAGFLDPLFDAGGWETGWNPACSRCPARAASRRHST